MGNILKLIRITLDLSVKEVSNITNLPSSYICDIESKRKKISYDMLLKFSNWYNMPASKIVSLSEKQEQGFTRTQLLLEIVEYYVAKEDIKKPLTK